MVQHVETIPATDFDQVHGTKDETENRSRPLNSVVDPKLEQGVKEGLWNGIISFDWEFNLSWTTHRIHCSPERRDAFGYGHKYRCDSPL